MSDVHHEKDFATVNCTVVTISDTRREETDTSGQRIKELLLEAGHRIAAYTIVPDEPHQIKLYVQRMAESGVCEAAILNGGTGLSARDQTFDIVSQLIDKPIPGFGELFRHLSYQDVGPKAILSRAVAGTSKRVVIYSVPGSTPAVELAVTRIILPTLAHTVAVVRNEL